MRYRGRECPLPSMSRGQQSNAFTTSPQPVCNLSQGDEVIRLGAEHHNAGNALEIVDSRHDGSRERRSFAREVGISDAVGDSEGRILGPMFRQFVEYNVVCDVARHDQCELPFAHSASPPLLGIALRLGGVSSRDFPGSSELTKSRPGNSHADKTPGPRHGPRRLRRASSHRRDRPPHRPPPSWEAGPVPRYPAPRCWQLSTESTRSCENLSLPIPPQAEGVGGPGGDRRGLGSPGARGGYSARSRAGYLPDVMTFDGWL